MNDEVVVIGIAGPSQCGKSTLAIRLVQKYKKLGYDCFQLSLDWFFKPKENLPMTKDWKGESIRNHECPESIDWDSLINNEKFGILSMKKKSKKYFIIEGFLLFVNAEVADLCDIKIWMECKLEDGYSRRARKKKNKNDTFFSKEYYESNVWGNFLNYRDTQLKNAGEDVITLNSSENPIEEIVEMAFEEIGKKCEK